MSVTAKHLKNIEFVRLDRVYVWNQLTRKNHFIFCIITATSSMQLRVIHKTHLTNFDLLLDKAIETLILAMTLTMTKTVLAKTSCKKNCSRCWMDLRHRRWQWTSQSWSASWHPPAGDGHQQRDNKSATYIKYLQKGENTTEVKFAGTMILLLLITTAQRFILGQIESYCQLNIIHIT